MPDPASLRQSTDSPRALDLDVYGVDRRHLRRTVARRYEAATQRLTLDFQYEVVEPDGSWYAYPSTFVMYVYRASELQRLFQSAGFQVDRLIGSYDGEPYTNDSHHLISLARPAAQ